MCRADVHRGQVDPWAPIHHLAAPTNPAHAGVHVALGESLCSSRNYLFSSIYDPIFCLCLTFQHSEQLKRQEPSLFPFNNGKNESQRGEPVSCSLVSASRP